MKKLEISALAFSKDKDQFKKDLQNCIDNDVLDLHYDVMDNIFVPNYSFQNLEYLDEIIEKGFSVSVHLMVQDVEPFLKKLVYKDVKYITFHCESQDIERSIEFIRFIRSKNIKAGIAIKPKTNLKEYQKLIKISDVITVMSVEPGFGGQKYIPTSGERIDEIKKIAKQNVIIEVDGGINNEVLPLIQNKANLFVSGSFLYKNLNNANEIKKILK